MVHLDEVKKYTWQITNHQICLTPAIGKSSDRSSPTNGRYFVTANLPFAIDVAETFDWVVEYQSIINAHKVFWDWADSGGSRYADWYTKIRSIELITYFIQLKLNLVYLFWIKQRASLFFNKKRSALFYIYLFEYPFITKTCKIEAIEK
jgi:hypothetical protein